MSSLLDSRLHAVRDMVLHVLRTGEDLTKRRHYAVCKACGFVIHCSEVQLSLLEAMATDELFLVHLYDSQHCRVCVAEENLFEYRGVRGVVINPLTDYDIRVLGALITIDV